MWMLKSSLRSFFELKTLNGRREARCLHCDKRYPEGESTGNMAKHVRALHPAAWKAKEGKILKTPPRNVTFRRLESLRVSQWVADEHRRKIGELETLMLVVEHALPLSLVQSASWAKWNDRCSPNSSIKSSTTLVKKLHLYQKHMNRSLRLNLRDSQFANIQFDIWISPGGESFLGVMVSFAPNLLNKSILQQAKTPKILLNNSGCAQSTHLIDFVSLGTEKITDKHLCETLLLVLEKYELKDMTATITMAKNPCNESLFAALVYKVFGSPKPFAHRMFGKTREIYCMVYALNLQLERGTKLLFGCPIFSNACERINSFARVTGASSHTNAGLKIPEIRFIPVNSSHRWTSIWSQLNTFFNNFSQYEAWYIQLINNGQEDLASKLGNCINIESRAIKLLEYFVQSFAIFNDLITKLQQDGFDHLANGVPTSYLLESYYKMCAKVLNGARVAKSRAGYDFSCLNGSVSLAPEDKEIVLDALQIAGCMHQEFMGHVRNNPLYYVAVILDPSAKTDAIYKMMSPEEASERTIEAQMFLNRFLEEYRENSVIQDQASADENPYHASSSMYFDRRCLSTNGDSQGSVGSVNEEEAGSRGSISEWLNYQEEPLCSVKSREDAIAWWYERRQKYPVLFELSVSLLYTRLSTCSIQRCFSSAVDVMKEDKNCPENKNFESLMVLRDRFTKFGFFDGPALDPNFSDGVSDESSGGEAVFLEDHGLSEFDGS
ncbi:putative transposase of the Rover hAT-like DNA transposon [Lachancea thermotolerans]